MSEDGPALHPCARFDWERIVRRARIDRDTKLVGFILAQYGDKDGGRIGPGTQRVADALDVSKRTAERHIGALLQLGLIERTSAGGGPSRAPARYRLTVPEDLFDRVELLGPDEIAPPRQRRPRKESSATQDGGSSPVDNHRTPAILCGGRSEPAETELPPSGSELPPNPRVSTANDPPVTCSVLADQETTHRPPKTSPEVSTSPAIHSPRTRSPSARCCYPLPAGRHTSDCPNREPLRGAS